MTRASKLAGMAFLVALLGVLALMLIDTYSTSSCDSTGCTSGSETLLEANGASVLALLVIPLLVTAGVFVSVQRRGPHALEWVAAALLLLLCLLAIASIGFVFLPAAVLVLAAVALDARDAHHPI